MSGPPSGGALGACSTSGGAPAVAAVLTTALTGVNNDLTFLAKTAGTAGNSITVALVATGNDTPLSVDVASSAITVNLATGSGGAVTSTATEVRNAINVDAEAAALITASLAPGNSGSGVVTALSAANLAYNDSVWTHAQGVDNQLSDRYFALAFDIRRAFFQAQHMFAIKLKFSHIFDRDDSFILGNKT